MAAVTAIHAKTQFDTVSVLTSRRRFLKSCVVLATVPCASRRLVAESPRALKLTHEFKGRLCDISSDANSLCLDDSRTEYDLKDWTYDGGRPRSGGLQVIDLRTLKTVYSTRLRSFPTTANFFADGHHLYAQSFSLRRPRDGKLVTQRATINLEDRSLVEQLSEEPTEHFPLRWPVLVGYAHSGTLRRSSLFTAGLPDFAVERSVPYAAISGPPQFGPPRGSGAGALVYGNDTPLAISADRNTIVYGTGHHIVCRRADLDLKWTKSIPTDYFGASWMDVTPTGSHVAAAMSDPLQKNTSIRIYDGRDGGAIAQLPLNGYDGISLSPDGSLLAVSGFVQTEKYRGEPTVTLHEIPTGRVIARVHHPAVNPGGRNGPFLLSIGSHFSPDGKRLITASANRVRVWVL